MTKKDLVCPECGEKLEVDQSDYSYCGDDIVVGYVDGTYLKCGKGYAWVEFYKLTEITDLTEVEV